VMSVVSELIHRLGGPGAVALWCSSFITGDAVTAWGLRDNIPWRWRSRVNAMVKARSIRLTAAERERLFLYFKPEASHDPLPRR
jgi:hypothetical protein